MLAKVLVFTFAAAVLCEEHAYTIRTQHEPAKEYRKHYEQVPIRVQEEQDSSREVQYSAAPESHGHGGHAYSSQSIIHHAALAGQQESQESHNEHIAPVYQYVQEEEEPANNEAPAHRVTPAQHYQTIQYVPPQQQNEVQSHPVHAHAQSQFRHSHEGLNYQNGGNAHEGVSFHQGAQLHTSVHHRVPVHNVAQAPQAAPVRHAAPVHYVGPVHHEAPIHHEAPVHHAVPVEHAEVYGHDSHDEPIDYYAYPKYQYEYKVEDPHTGDNKFQHEVRDGDVVKGVYSLQEADGSIRTVEYSSDKHTGFNAIVKHSAPGQHVEIKSHHQN